jgi:broad specificity phosphatase PhoE
VTLPLDEVLLVRHGETEWNRAGRRQGQLDSALTSDGLRQARRIAEMVAPLEPEGLFSSPRGRALSTANVIAGATRLVAEVVPELAEVHQGSFAGLTNAEIEALHPGELGRREQQKYRWRFPEGESYADADRRAGDALKTIAGRGSSRPAIVSHEMLARMLLRQLLGLDPAEALTWRLPHGTLLRVCPADRRVEHLVSD